MGQPPPVRLVFEDLEATGLPEAPVSNVAPLRRAISVRLALLLFHVKYLVVLCIVVG